MTTGNDQPGSPFFEGGAAWEKYQQEAEDALERKAADLWRADNPDASVFDCDQATKERYRRLATLSHAECDGGK